MNIANIRKDYTLKSLDITDVSENPTTQFKKWFDEALNANVLEVNAMTLATVQNNEPNARILLLKGISKKGFTFFTNYQSTKGQEIKQNNHASMVFFWKELERQVRIQGVLEKVSREESMEYFFSRPRASQIGAWVSNQSKIIESREVLENRVKELEEKFKNKEVDYPEHWGGYLLKPTKIEFWQGRSSRLHDRVLYTCENDNSWKIERLSP